MLVRLQVAIVVARNDSGFQCTRGNPGDTKPNNWLNCCILSSRTIESVIKTYILALEIEGRSKNNRKRIEELSQGVARG